MSQLERELSCRRQGEREKKSSGRLPGGKEGGGENDRSERVESDSRVLGDNKNNR